MRRRDLFLVPVAILIAMGTGVRAGRDDGDRDLPVITSLPASPTLSVSTVPSNGDVNPYGVAFVPPDFVPGGPLRPGDILVSNFNASSNLQGTGTTIVRISQNGAQSLFFQGANGLGLSTALGVLKRGFVLVGNVPSTNGLGTCTEVGGQETGVEQGSLLILDRRGHLVMNLSSKRLLDGPWDLTLKDDGDRAQVFVSNALSGTVVRLDLMIHDGAAADADRVVVTKATQIGSGYVHRCDPAAFVVGPTGLALDEESGTLYVASTGDNAIFAIRDATETASDLGTGRLVTSDPVHMHGPLGLARARNGDLITSQGDAVNPDPAQPSEIVEYTSTGRFVAQFPIDPSSGSAFGLALTPFEDGFRFAAVDDALNVLDVWVVP
ncbi:MAG TPA: hypothetical protein VGZ27_09210 [Vicinamibacterales bacterium]|jgi:hypothetical protein|nr:hypothetical protein [Vicinamibacterales bacterium]